MENDWVKVFVAEKNFNVELVKGLLEQHGIESIIMNKKDSEFLVGDIELYVKSTDVENAEKIIKENNQSE